jgi:serine/threonine protein kinase
MLQMRRSDGEAAGECLDEDTVLDLIEGRIDLAGDQRLADHLDRCEGCRGVVAGALRSESRGAPSSLKFARGATVGRYVLGEPLGAGAMGVVYSAYDPELDRRVALKFLRGSTGDSSGALQSLIAREGQAMAQLSHPNVVAVYDVGSFADHVYVAMELVEGVTLAEWLRAQRRGWREIVALFRQAGAGLAAAHAVGLVHRDFKPENVLVGRDGRARVSDFGLACPVESADFAAPSSAVRPSAESSRSPTRRLLAERLTRTGALVGTPAYMAPEQLAGSPVDARSDVFSFSVALFEALFGERPFSGPDKPALLAAIRERRLAHPGGRVPRWLRQAVVRGLEEDPESRWPDMQHVLHALEHAPVLTPQRASLAALTIALALTFGWYWHRSATACNGALSAWGNLWSEKDRARAQMKFASSGRPNAAHAFALVDRALQRYRALFIDAHEDACRATRVHRTQSEKLLDLRMTCLADRRRHAAALVRLYTDADADLVDHAADTLEGLAPIEGCADTRALAEPMPQPRDPIRRAAIARLSEQTAEAGALALASRNERSRAIYELALREAIKLDYPPLQAKLLLIEGRVEGDLGHLDQQVATYHRAAIAAMRGHDDGAAADAWSQLAYVRGYWLPFFDEAMVWAEYAEAAILRLGGDDEREATHSLILGSIHIAQQRPSEARPLLMRARQLYLASRGESYWRIGTVDWQLGSAAFDEGRVQEALALARRATQLWTQVLGPDHPRLLYSLLDEAEDLTMLGRIGEALPIYSRVIALLSASGNNHWKYPHSRLAVALRDQGRLEEALKQDQMAVQENWPCPALLGQGADLIGLNRAKEAMVILERAHPLCVVSHDRIPPLWKGEIEILLAHALALSGADRARAEALAKSGRARLVELAGRYGSYFADALRASDQCPLNRWCGWPAGWN